MNKRIYLLLVIPILLFACKPEGPNQPSGSVNYKIKFTTEDLGIVRQTQADDTVYTQFGNYITSLTPTILLSRIWTVGYIDTVIDFSSNVANMLQYINQNQATLPYSDTSRIVNFSNDSTVSFNPVVFGSVSNETGSFVQPQVDFKYFYFIPYYFYQEVELPAAYNGVTIDMFSVPLDPNPVVIQGNILKAKNYQMTKPIFPNGVINNYIMYIFGNCDSTYVVNPNGELVLTGANNPVGQDQNNLIVRSNLYDNMIFNTPQNGETRLMNGTLSFYTTNLIQVYAGADNIPYNSDDVFVYAPRFWERVTTRLVTE